MQMDLSFFLDKNLFNAGTSFFKQLNIRLNSSSTLSLPLKSILKDKFKSQKIFEKVSAACFLGLVDKSVFDDNLSLFEDRTLSYEQGAYLRSVVAGHTRYYGVPLNSPSISIFRKEVCRMWLRSLRRCSHKHRLTWERMQRLIAKWISPARVCHPYPLKRFGVTT